MNGLLPGDIITRDVCIIGGGASGTYAAIRLHDLGKSIVVVEQNSVLGGQTSTYTDPASGKRTEMGVVAWYNNEIVNNFFARLNVPLKTTDIERAGFTALNSIPVDFRTGELVTDVYSGNVPEGLANYIEQLAKYPYLEDGFDVPYPVPSDLLLPFGEFVEKYNIGGAIRVLYIFGNGMGDFLKQPTLYVFKLVSMESMQAFKAGSFQSTLNHNNQEIYEKAQVELGTDVILNSKVLSADRSGEYAEVHVQTPLGLKCIKAKKLLLTIPPKLENLEGFDLDTNERSLFSQFNNTGYYTAILKNTGIADNTEVRNFGADSPYNVPVLPGPYFLQASGISGLLNVKYCSPHPVSDETAKANIITAVQKLNTAGTLNTTTPEFVAFGSHTPFEMTVSVDAVQSGFYKSLYGLQGLKKTYWTGAAFHAQDSGKLWAFTEKLIPGIIDGL
ncbi:flavin-containing superfamily amine oxidase-like protein [Lepidopterella palustris CBS 459.81]|uniref:Flavin-containing superfamily amine oxidase-like protein n=1 Tax=Lepidopterella palustris CBS 459.81 TaxID=1314670 RepID=A0A8E2E297_9PEZI|nr:flavin-containing superfamily amine oxidase-like protein [Lepidopterella palustris CBS 459.81]